MSPVVQDAVQAILRFNAGREPRRLAIKYEKMACSAFAFFRGACHRYYERLPRESLTKDAPPGWICGDLHFENFGSFKGDNRLVYFDINDFDETCLAPITWDLVRFQASLMLGAPALRIGQARAKSLARGWLAQYATCLESGKPQWIERATARGVVGDLLESLRHRRQRKLLDERAPRKRKRRRLRLCGEDVDSIKALPASGDTKELATAIERFGRARGDTKAFRVLAVADRVAGTGSLGLERFVILVRGHGGRKGRNILLDAKTPPGSAPASTSPCQQPRWRSEAERVVTLQRRLQATSPAQLAILEVGSRSCVLRELMPSEDRVKLSEATASGLERALEDMAQVVAWAHLRGAGRQGSAAVDEMIAFAREREWQDSATALAVTTARDIEADYGEFAAAYREGRFADPADSLRAACGEDLTH